MDKFQRMMAKMAAFCRGCYESKNITEPMKDTEYQKPPPPSTSTVARRALILATVSCHGFIDNDKERVAASSLAKKPKIGFSLWVDDQFGDRERKILSTQSGNYKSMTA